MTKRIDIYDRGYVDGVRAFARALGENAWLNLNRGALDREATDTIVFRRKSPGYDPPQECLEEPNQ